MNEPTRRQLLRGMGVTLALPLLESLGRATPSPAPPERLLFVYTPNGVHLPDWRLPAGSAGPLPAELPRSLRELERHRASFSVLSGLTLDKARSNGDGPGDHARSAGAFLTCRQPVKADGTVLDVGVSADQVAARSIGRDTRLASLQVGCDPGMQSGQCDSGYPCAYSSHVSWSSRHTPLSPEIHPRALFDRLFGVGLEHLDAEERARRLRQRRSILDYVRADAKRLAGELGASDRRKLEEYLTGIRELEQRLDRAADPVAVERERPTGIPDDFGEHAALMAELLALAFATDSTRVATFMLANEGSERLYRDQGAKEGHHTLSHHGKDPNKRSQIAAIDRFHLSLLAGLLDRLAAAQEDSVSLLDRTLVLYGSGIADGDDHDHHDLPLLLAGGGSRVPLGRHLELPVGTPVANLYLRLFDWLGVRDAATGGPVESFGDSTGVLAI